MKENTQPDLNIVTNTSDFLNINPLDNKIRLQLDFLKILLSYQKSLSKRGLSSFKTNVGGDNNLKDMIDDLIISINENLNFI